jgi:hypothetical protein
MEAAEVGLAMESEHGLRHLSQWKVAPLEGWMELELEEAGHARVDRVLTVE